ncbi:hypothetical protein [Pseudomonas sp. ICMP 561]|uniref:hypothetical protein n=1 Tax=Pseudomonas sp. ICMP 561 TaxID=1718918 RepID=UPI000C07A984|nr:hypothetical protein [Pseudomonas sp. ICMP 561]PHN29815.1 hypothetical protein AO242_02005 [Pseudomonas sp. ICMP 561]
MSDVTMGISMAGDLDPDFSQTDFEPGRVEIWKAFDWSLMDVFFASIAPASNGQMYVSGYFSDFDTGQDFYCLGRLEAGGARDIRFGNDGVVTGTFSEGSKISLPSKVVIQGDGKVVMLELDASSRVEADPELIVVRFLDTGELDTEFGLNGIRRYDLTAEGYRGLVFNVGALQVLADGFIYGSVTGTRDPGNIESVVIFRLTMQGDWDLSFGNQGILDISVQGKSMRGTDFVIQPDGGIVLAGYTTSPQDGSATGRLYRFDSRGRPDNSFGPGDAGFLEVIVLGKKVEISTIAMRLDGSLALAGVISSDFSDLDSSGFIMGITADGVPDPSFSNGEVVETPINDDYWVQWMSAIFQADGRLLVMGRSQPKSESIGDSYMYVTRYRLDGILDSSFGVEGRVETFVGGYNEPPTEIQLQADGKIVVGLNGTSFNRGLLLRYLND